MKTVEEIILQHCGKAVNLNQAFFGLYVSKEDIKQIQLDAWKEGKQLLEENERLKKEILELRETIRCNP